MPSPIVLAIAAAAGVELLLAAIWWRPYFQSGLVLAREELPLASSIPSESSASVIREQLGESSAVVVHQAAAGTIWARLKLGFNSFAYTRVEIRVEPVLNRVVAVYRLAWYPIVLALVLLLQPLVYERPVAPRVAMVAVLSAFVYFVARRELKLLRPICGHVIGVFEGRRSAG